MLRELAYTGRVVSGREAFDVGLVTAVHDDPLAAARDTARHIAARSPDAIRAMKKMFNERRDLDRTRSLALEAALQAGVLGKAQTRKRRWPRIWPAASQISTIKRLIYRELRWSRRTQKL